MQAGHVSYSIDVLQERVLKAVSTIDRVKLNLPRTHIDTHIGWIGIGKLITC